MSGANASAAARSHQENLTRRHFLGQAGIGIGAAALAELLPRDLLAESETVGLPGLPHFAPKAKRVIYMFQSGAPSQLDLFDYKPQLAKRHGEDLPSVGKIREASLYH